MKLYAVILVSSSAKRISTRSERLFYFYFGRKILYIISSYAPQSGLSESEKDTFFFNLLSCISIVPAEEMLLVCGDLNGHVGKMSSGFEDLHGGHGYGVRNPEAARILELCVAADLVIANTFFTMCDCQLLTFRSGNACSQIDYILFRKSDFISVCDVKVIGGEECVPQHKLLVRDKYIIQQITLYTTKTKIMEIVYSRSTFRISKLCS